MVRAQIQLSPELHRALKRWAADRGISIAEAVRRCVASQLSRESAPSTRNDRVREALSVVGKYADPGGASRLAKDHDDYLADAYGS
jgi:hypothetical protein